jgi:protein gp37
VTKIEWASLGLPKGVTWNPIRARNAQTGKRGWHCEKVSPACEHCYAEALNAKAGDTGGTGLPYKPGHRQESASGRAGPERAAKAEIYLDERTLLQPLSWRAPRGVFVASMTDLFGDWVKDEWLDRIFAVMALRPQHRFALLTKRPARMREYIRAVQRPGAPERIIGILSSMQRAGAITEAESMSAICRHAPMLPHVWLGVTAEDQKRADERIPDLLATPAAVRFVSNEPSLDAIDWKRWLPTKRAARRPDGTPFLAPHFYMTRCEYCGWVGSSELCGADSFGDDSDVFCPSCRRSIVGEDLPCLDLVICGGESGPHARDNDFEANARDLLKQCRASGVAFFGKQNVGKRPLPADLAVREFPEAR